MNLQVTITLTLRRVTEWQSSRRVQKRRCETRGSPSSSSPKVPGAPFPPITPQQPVFRNIVVRDVHLMDVTGKALGAFITLADTPVVGLTLANITLSPKSAKASETKPGGWSCNSGKGALAPVYACNSTATMLTPPLANPHGCALSCK